MPGGRERELRRRIGSIQSTKKITRAMELIAATRVVKAMQRANAARPYARLITGVIEDLAKGGAEVEHPLLRREADEDVRRVGFIVMTGDRGLAGAYNTSVIRTAERQLMGHQSEGKDYSLCCVGRKSAGYFRFRNYRIDHEFTGFSDSPSYGDARRIAETVVESFVSGRVDQVELVYTEFVSMGTQRVVVRRFLPLVDIATIAGGAGGALGGSGPTESDHASGSHADAPQTGSFEFEPSPEAVLQALLPRYTEARLYGALLDAAASEHASRQRAMKAATDNAEELITKLSACDEPGPPRRHHHRDHGDRRRRRSTRWCHRHRRHRQRHRHGARVFARRRRRQVKMIAVTSPDRSPAARARVRAAGSREAAAIEAERPRLSVESCKRTSRRWSMP